MLNRAKGRKSTVFFLQKIDNKLLWQRLGTTLLPKLLTLHICFVHSPPLTIEYNTGLKQTLSDAQNLDIKT